MVVTCHSCAAKFRVDDAKIGTRGVKVKCSKCQTMIIVKPEADQAIVSDDVPTKVTAPPPPAPAPELDMPAMPTFDDEHQAPTRVQALPANVLADLRAQAAAAQSQPPAAPPPLTAKAPPPLKAPPPAPVPAPVVPRAPALDDAGDLFSDPFANPPPSTPPPEQQRFVDAGGGLDQPTLELDLGAGIPSSPPPQASAPDVLAELPRFDNHNEEPQFAGGMSSEGTVTKPHSLKDLEAQAQRAASATPQPLAQLDLQPASQQKTKEGDSVAAIAERERKRAQAAGGSSKAVALLGRAAIIVLCLAGVAGELIVFRAGGLQGLIGHASRTGDGAALRRVTLYPVLAHDGTTFMVLRGDVQTFGAQNAPPKVEISVDGKVLATQATGTAIDDSALVLRGEIVPKPASDPHTFRYAWKDTRPLDQLKTALSVRVVP